MDLTKDILLELTEDYIMHEGTPQQYDGDPNGSGRYRQGSGENPNQHHAGDFIDRIKELSSKGLTTEAQQCEAMHISSTQYRKLKKRAVENRAAALSERVKSMYNNDGMTKTQIARELNMPESTVRLYLKSNREAKKQITEQTIDFLRDQVNEKKMILVGKGTEIPLNVSRDKLNMAIDVLSTEEGYNLYKARVPQVTNPNRSTEIMVLATPDIKQSDIYKDGFGNVKSIVDYKNFPNQDGTDNFKKAFRYPASLDSKRMMVRYAEEGGLEKDGLIEIRRGLKDIELDGAAYAQVRILVDGTHYMKGMAVYSDDIPEGKDIVFNTNKHIGTPALGEDKNNTVLKHIKKDDPMNPFGSAIKEEGGQHEWIDENGEAHLSVINKRASAGDWGEWSSEISPQFLSKQPQLLINQQLKLSKIKAQNEYDEIKEITNPILRKQMMQEFADQMDSAAVELKAASFAGTRFQVILPLTTLKENECYAPNYKDGTEVALVRYPHAGTFEIPKLVVNNRNKEGIERITPNAPDAIGITSKAAERLSGADFDGDTVMVIPITDKSDIKSTRALEGLQNFDPKALYKATNSYVDEDGNTRCFRGDKEFRYLTKRNEGIEMGKVSNLITDMTLQGATTSELTRAVKHSMVVIDANKHVLDYEQSYIDNGIEELQRKYQGVWNEKTHRWNTPARTLISAKKSEVRLDEREEGALFDKRTGDPVTMFKKDNNPDNNVYVNDKTGEVLKRGNVKKVDFDPVTGEKFYHNTNRMYEKAKIKNAAGKSIEVSVFTDYKGDKYYTNPDTNERVKVTNEKIVPRWPVTKSTKMAETNDAYTLSTGTKQENAYADYANYLKHLANQARVESLLVTIPERDPEAYKKYKEERETLDIEYMKAKANGPKEQMAQIIASNRYQILTKDNPHMEDEQKKKLKQRLITQARIETGAKRNEIVLTDRLWEAIQHNAISKTKLADMFRYMNKDVLRNYATPKPTTALSDTKVRRIHSMINSGYTNSEIAKQLGVSVSTIVKYSQEGGNN